MVFTSDPFELYTTTVRDKTFKHTLESYSKTVVEVTLFELVEHLQKSVHDKRTPLCQIIFFY